MRLITNKFIISKQYRLYYFKNMTILYACCHKQVARVLVIINI